MSSEQVIAKKTPILQSCCCGCTLFAGTMIITILDVIGAIISFMIANFHSASLQVVRNEMDNGKFKNLSTGSKELINRLYGLYIFSTLLSLAAIVVDSLAIHGARTRKPRLLTPWLYTMALNEVTHLFISIIMLAKAGDYADALKELQDQLGEDSLVLISVSGYSPDQMYTTIIGLIIQLGLAVYFFLIVYSFYVELRNPPVPPTVYPAGAPGYFPLGNTTVVVPPGANTIYANSPAGAAGFQVDMQAPPSYEKLTIN